MEETELKPCPFCWSEATLVLNNSLYQVECDYCVARAPDDSKRQTAIDDWNRRIYDDFFEEIKRHADNGHKALSIKWLLNEITKLKKWNEPL